MHLVSKHRVRSLPLTVDVMEGLRKRTITFPVSSQWLLTTTTWNWAKRHSSRIHSSPRKLAAHAPAARCVLRTAIALASWLQIWEFPLLLQIWFARLTHQTLRECCTDGYTLLWLQEIRTIQMENFTEKDLREAQIWKLPLAVNVWTLWTCRPYYPNMW